MSKKQTKNIASISLLQPLLMLAGVFRDLIMDFIEGLPKSQGRYVLYVAVESFT